MGRRSPPPGRFVIASTIVRVGVGVACAIGGLLIELGLDQVVAVGPWLVVAFVAGVVAAILGGPLGGIAAAIVGIPVRLSLVPAWVPALGSVDVVGWQLEIVVAAAALVGGLWLRSLILPRRLRRRSRHSPEGRDDADEAAPQPAHLPAARRRDGTAAAVIPDAAPGDLAMFAAAIADLRTTRTPAQIADALARHAAALSGAPQASVYVSRDGSEGLLPLGQHGPPDPTAPDRLAVPSGSGRVSTAPEVDATAAIVELPFGRPSAAVGVVRLGRRPDGPALRLGPLLDATMQLAADAIERGRLQAAGRQSAGEASGAVGRVAILSRLAAELVGGTTIEEVARTLVDLAVDDLGAGFAVVHVADPSSGTFELAHARGYPSGLVVGQQTIAADAPSPVARAAADGTAVEVAGEDGWRQAFPSASNVPAITGVRAISALPMQAGGVVQGVLTIGWRTAADRARVNRDLLAAAADQGAQALERALLHANDEDARRFQEAFIGVVSHELRTPITTIVAGSRLLHRRLRDDPRAAELSEDIEVEADRLSRIVDDLLVLSRLERRHLTVGDEPVHLDHLMNRIVRSESNRWPGHRFVVPPTAGSHVVLGDDTYVEQILRNLISNAAKYSPIGSLVEVVVDDAPDGDVNVRVLDEGPGIALSEVEDLFSLFYRSPSTAASAAGAGIGLFVSRRLVAEMGGRMWARPRDGRGSEFGFSLRRFPFDEAEPDDYPPEGTVRAIATAGATSRAAIEP